MFHRERYGTTVIVAAPTSALRLAVTTTDPVATADTKPAEEPVATAVFALAQVTAESPDCADATRDDDDGGGEPRDVGRHLRRIR